jgi:hypothetical protein
VWEEGGIFPQVVFEVWYPGNRAGQMTRKRAFYHKHGAEEYYVVDPEDNDVEGWIRDGDAFRKVVDMNGWRSPRLGIRFDFSDSTLTISYPDGRRFLTFLEIGLQAEQDRQNAETARQENERLRQALRAAGIDPDKLSG